MKKLDSKTVFEGRIARVTLDDVELPNSNRCRMEIVHHPGGAAAVAIDRAERVCLLRQYRYALDEWLWELPAGKIDDGEAPRQTAKRELADEAGVEAGRWKSLGRYVSSPGIFTEIVHLFLAMDLTAGSSRLEPAEVLEVHWIDLSQAIRLAESGEIADGKTVVGLWRARSLLAR